MNKLSELICTRINHDIIGNVGAVCNAVELLEEGDLEFIDDIKAILKTSSEVLSARLKFFRIVFGSNNTNLDNLSQIVQNYINSITSKSYPIKLTFNLDDKSKVKIVLLVVMILSEMMIKGGAIYVQGDKIIADCPQYNKDKLNSFVSFLPDLSSPQLAPTLYLYEILQEKSCDLDVGYQENLLEVNIKSKENT